MKKLINELKRMQQLAGLLKENDAANDYAMDLVDLISSGAGEATGLNTPAFTRLVAKIKGENMIDVVSQALVDYINSGVGFTQEDIDALTAAGFNMQGAGVGGELEAKVRELYASEGATEEQIAKLVNIYRHEMENEGMDDVEDFFLGLEDSSDPNAFIELRDLPKYKGY